MYEFKHSKETNRRTMETYMTKEFWQPEYADMFSPDIVVDIPSAPPGMPQHLDAFDYGQYLSWLRRTVTNYCSDVQEFYGTPDPDVFWGIRDVSADVRWCSEPGRFESKIFCRVEFKRGRINYIKINWNPLRFLYAVHAEVPIFRMDIYDARVDAYMAEHPAPAHAEGDAAALDASPQAVAKRIQDNLDSFRRPDYWDAVGSMATFAPDYDSKVWFLPPEMKEFYPKDMMERVEAWSALSCPNIDFDEAGKYWATDDPHIYFCEYMCSGVVDWIGNNAPNRYYRNRYFYVLRFDELGRIAVSEEILNPINKFNSIGVSIPTFPYFC